MSSRSSTRRISETRHSHSPELKASTTPTARSSRRSKVHLSNKENASVWDLPASHVTSSSSTSTQEKTSILTRSASSAPSFRRSRDMGLRKNKTPKTPMSVSHISKSIAKIKGIDVEKLDHSDSGEESTSEVNTSLSRLKSCRKIAYESDPTIHSLIRPSFIKRRHSANESEADVPDVGLSAKKKSAPMKNFELEKQSTLKVKKVNSTIRSTSKRNCKVSTKRISTAKKGRKAKKVAESHDSKSESETIKSDLENVVSESETDGFHSTHSPDSSSCSAEEDSLSEDEVVYEEDEEEEYEIVKSSKRTPKKKTISKRQKVSAQKIKLSPHVLPDRIQISSPASLTQKPGELQYENARERLHATARPIALPCREQEYCEIMSCLESAIDSSDGTCIYISGVPGTGKTATVQAIMNQLIVMQENHELNPFDYVEINGMKLTDPSQAYSILWETLSGEKVSVKHASTLLDKYFSKPTQRNRPCVILIDELDQFVTKKQKVIYNLFDWPNRKGSKLIVVAIANTMDLPERVMLNRVSSRIGLTRLNFSPYTFSQLIKIVESRLSGTSIFKPEAIEVCARKVSSVSGDARRALEICRYAISLVQKSGEKQEKVDVTIILKAVKELNESPALMSLMHASLHQMIFLVSIIKRTRMSGITDVELHDVIHEHIRICKMQSILAPNLTDLSFLGHTLGEYKWIIVEPKKIDLKKKVRLNMMEEDVIYVLRKSTDARIKDLL